jgi:hypothetical protein
MSEIEFVRKRLGALPSRWDSRNYRVMRVTPLQFEQLPDEYDELLGYAPKTPWPDQGDIGTCVGQDGAIVMEITNTLLKEYADRTRQPSLLRYIHIDLSAGWLYHWSRKHSFPPIPDMVEGSTNFGLMKALNKVGTATEAAVPTDNVSPWDGITYTEEDQETAKQYAIDSYWNIDSNPNDIKAAIYGLTHKAPYKMPDGSDGKIPLVSAYPVYESYMQARTGGMVPMPDVGGERLLGGHSSCILGWKIIDGEEYFINFNSWGSDFGDGGLCYMPVDYPFYSNDWWLVHNGPPSEIDSDCPVASVWAGIYNGFAGVFGAKTRLKPVVP